MAPVLPRAFYRRETELVARELLGCRLVREHAGERSSGIIVETEAYVGFEDPACHGFRGRRTARTEALFQDGGWSYVYFVYGMHWCFNAVTRTPNEPEAVLIRALMPDEGLDQMRARRSPRARKAMRDRDLANGPAKLCEALGIDGSHDRRPLSGPALRIERGPRLIAPSEIGVGPRVGVDYAGEAALWPLRFFLKGNAFVSKAPSANPFKAPRARTPARDQNCKPRAKENR